ncbi:hypothetical protein G3480_12585 [Thiorhodococcus mannitoliphagus]|uniref:Uncharacterized protein n=1 Tax=Thiorhodococcus mannitoliphagus TaxID=329406 RepID=A0A6P1DTL3_9GAMM|nr:hypothetical protein [Thiorhodococcus mannitoliphagus]NEX21139.1 hypothetical protein [Thiorhodococcus mannitoliphagus]
MTKLNTEIKAHRDALVPGISPGIASLVRQEASRWREAASANQWAVLSLRQDRVLDSRPPLGSLGAPKLVSH